MLRVSSRSCQCHLPLSYHLTLSKRHPWLCHSGKSFSKTEEQRGLQLGHESLHSPPRCMPSANFIPNSALLHTQACWGILYSFTLLRLGELNPSFLLKPLSITSNAYTCNSKTKPFPDAPDTQASSHHSISHLSMKLFICTSPTTKQTQVPGGRILCNTQITSHGASKIRY